MISASTGPIWMKIARSDAEWKIERAIVENGNSSSRNNGDIAQNVVHALTRRFSMKTIGIHLQNVALGQLTEDV